MSSSNHAFCVSSNKAMLSVIRARTCAVGPRHLQWRVWRWCRTKQYNEMRTRGLRVVVDAPWYAVSDDSSSKGNDRYLGVVASSPSVRRADGLSHVARSEMLKVRTQDQSE